MADWWLTLVKFGTRCVRCERPLLVGHQMVYCWELSAGLCRDCADQQGIDYTRSHALRQAHRVTV